MKTSYIPISSTTFIIDTGITSDTNIITTSTNRRSTRLTRSIAKTRNAA